MCALKSVSVNTFLPAAESHHARPIQSLRWPQSKKWCDTSNKLFFLFFLFLFISFIYGQLCTAIPGQSTPFQVALLQSIAQMSSAVSPFKKSQTWALLFRPPQKTTHAHTQENKSLTKIRLFIVSKRIIYKKKQPLVLPDCRHSQGGWINFAGPVSCRYQIIIWFIRLNEDTIHRRALVKWPDASHVSLWRRAGQ